jgi:hypothetical protein
MLSTALFPLTLTRGERLPSSLVLLLCLQLLPRWDGVSKQFGETTTVPSLPKYNNKIFNNQQNKTQNSTYRKSNSLKCILTTHQKNTPHKPAIAWQCCAGTKHKNPTPALPMTATTQPKLCFGIYIYIYTETQF